MNKHRIPYMQGILHDLKYTYSQKVPWLTATTAVLPKAQIWHLPIEATDLLLNTMPDKVSINNVKLPHPSVLLEYQMDLSAMKLSKDHIPCIHRAAFLNDVGDDLNIIFFFKVNEKGINAWAPIPPISIAYKDIYDLDSWFLCPKKGYLYLDIGKVKFHTSYNQMRDDTVNIVMQENLIDIHCVLSFIQIAACSNAASITIPVSSKILKTAARRNKYSPRFYKEFNLKGKIQSKTAAYTINRSNPVTPHWRKGHIRMQPTKKGPIRIWIHPTIVGTGTPAVKPVEVTI